MMNTGIDTGFALKLSATVGTLLVLLIALIVCKLAVGNYAARKSLNTSRAGFVKKIVTYALVGLAVLVLLVIWGVQQNVGLFVSSIVGLIAIGFVAVWSMLSNILAGFLIFFSDPFRIGDDIVILPEDIAGKAVDIKLLFVVLEDSDGSRLHVPNNLLFQRIIKRVGPSAAPAENDADAGG